MRAAFKSFLAIAICSHVIVTDAFSSQISRSNLHIRFMRKELARSQYNIVSQNSKKSLLHHSSSDENVDPSEVSDSGMEDEDNYMGGQQYDEYPMANQPEDAEMIEAMRLERIIANDRWQSCLIRDKQGGEWTGSYEMYTPKKGPNGFLLNKADTGTVRTSITAGTFNLEGVPIFFNEQYSSTAPLSGSDKETAAHSLLLSRTRDHFEPSDFRPSVGNQIVANVYSVCNIIGGDIVYGTESNSSVDGSSQAVPESYVAEIAVREGCIRTRVRYAYTDQLSAAMDEVEKAAGKYDVFLAGLVVIRECLTDTSLADAQPLFDQTLGPGIYDPQVAGEPYVQINFPGKLSLLFPRGISGALNKVGHALTIEWEGKDMRYQVDRRFCELTDGQLRSLELTEVRAADAQTYPAGFAIKPDYMQYNT